MFTEGGVSDDFNVFRDIFNQLIGCKYDFLGAQDCLSCLVECSSENRT